jgi:WD40 repeat protein
MRTLPLLLLLLARQEDEWPKDVPRDWAKIDLVKEHGKFAGTNRIEFAGEKARFIALHGSNGKAIVYEFKDWLSEKFLMTQAIPCTGTAMFFRDYTGEVKKLGETTKHMWVNNKDRPMTVTPDGSLIVLAKNERTVQVFENGKAEAPKQEFDAHGRGLMDLFIWGRQFLVTVAAQEVRVWNLNKLTEKPKEVGFGNVVRSFALARPDNRYIALVFGKFVHALDITTMKGKDIAEDMEAGGKVEFSDDGKFLLIVTPAKTALVYQAGGDWKEVFKLAGDEKKVVTGALSPTGAYLAWMDAASTLHMTHVASGFDCGTIPMPGWAVGSMTWHPGGDQLYLCAANGKSIRVVGKK